jgi:hypothetical protein
MRAVVPQVRRCIPPSGTLRPTALVVMSTRRIRCPVLVCAGRSQGGRDWNNVAGLLPITETNNGRTRSHRPHGRPAQRRCLCATRLTNGPASGSECRIKLPAHSSSDHRGHFRHQRHSARGSVERAGSARPMPVRQTARTLQRALLPNVPRTKPPQLRKETVVEDSSQATSSCARRAGVYEGGRRALYTHQSLRRSKHRVRQFVNTMSNQDSNSFVIGPDVSQL